MENSYRLTVKNVIDMSVEDLAEVIERSFTHQIPNTFASIEDLRTAQSLLSVFYRDYAFLSTLAVAFNACKRRLRIDQDHDADIISGLEKDFMSKHDLLKNAADVSKRGWDTVSRMVTIRKMEYDEIHMTEPVIRTADAADTRGKGGRA